MTRSIILQLCLGGMLVIVITRATVLFEPMPGWDGSPMNTLSAIVGLGPAGCLLLDLASFFTAGLTCLVAGRRLGWIAMASLAASASIVAHTLLFARDDAEPLPIAGAWASGFSLLAAASVVAGRRLLRRGAVAVLFGVLCLLLAKGAGQLLIEHPAVVASFDRDPSAVLADRGYQPGSAAALQFERRLRQPDITGWFGLSNVLAAYFAAGATGCIAVCAASRKFARDWAFVATLLLGTACWVGVILTGSKAGLAVAGTGSVAVIVAMQLTSLFGVRRFTRATARIAGVGLWLLPPAALATRALLMPFEGELSLLFRWFYADSAVAIAKDSLPAGTGADGFRAEYAVAKPPIAPETVTSSHNAVLDWAAMLGIFGLPCILAIVGAVWCVSLRLGSTPRLREVSSPSRAAVLCMVLVLAVPVVASATLEAEAALLELSLLRVAGLALAGLAAAAIWKLRPSPSAISVMAIVVLTHAQLDMVMFHPGSIPLALFLLGLAVPGGRSANVRRWAGVLPCLAAIGIAPLAVRALQWEGSLRNAFAAAQDIAIESQAEPGRSAADGWRIETLVSDRRRVIVSELQSAAAVFRDDPRAWLAVCDVELLLGGPTQAAWDAATAASVAELSTRTLGRLGLVADAIAQSTTSSTDRRVWIDRSLEALVDASARDPHGPHFPSLVAEIEAREGNAGAAAVWAARALQSDANYALDPLAQLPADRRKRLEALVNGSVSRP